MIRIVSILEFPCVGSYLRQPFATHGTRFDWPEGRATGDALDHELSEFYSGLLEKCDAKVVTQRDPSGRVAFFGATENGPLVIGGVPLHILERKTHEKRRILRYFRSPAFAPGVIQKSAATHFLLQATIHGIVGSSSRILGCCEAYESGDTSPMHLLNIRKGCHQISSLITSTRVLYPDWAPDYSKNPLNSLHPAVMMQRRTWEADLNERGIRVELGRCFAQLHMDTDVLTAVLYNIFSNLVKHAKPNSRVDVTFLPGNDYFRIRFEMLSRRMLPEEVPQLSYLGRRGRYASGTGSGIGLAIIVRALAAYDSKLEIVAGEAIQNTLYAKNVFDLCFSARLVRC